MADIYVNASVSYGSGSGSSGNPFSLLEGLENLNATDKTVIMQDGTYTTQIFNNNQNIWTLPTIEGNRQTVQAENAGNVTWKTGGSYALQFKQICRYITFQDIVFDGSNMTGTESNMIHIFQQASRSTIHDVIWNGCTFRYAPRHNIYMDSASSGCSLINCISYDAGQATTSGLWNNYYIEGDTHIVRGCQAYYTSGHVKGSFGGNGGNFRLSTNSGWITTSEGADQSDGHLIEDCYARGGTYGVVVSFDDHIIRNNEFIDHRYGTSNFAIEYLTINVAKFIGGTTTNDNLQVYNNTLYNSSTAGTGVAFVTFTGATATNASVKNNIEYGFSTAHDFGGATVATATNLTTDPSFVDAATQDFHIEADGDADGTGTDLSATGFSDDKDGDTRPSNGSTWCIGAYEVKTPASHDPVNSLTSTTMTAVTELATSVPTIVVQDADGNLVRVELTVTQGTLAVPGTSGATVQTGS